MLAYSNHAIVSVTANKASNLFVMHYPKSMAITPSSSVVMSTGIPMIASQSLLYTANITGLNPDSSYVVYVSGTEEFGPSIATPVSDTRTAFTTVKTGEKPSEGKQCPKGWAVIDGLLLYSQCSGNGICFDNQCTCYASYQGEGCNQLKGEDAIAANSTHHIIHSSFHLDTPSTEDQDQDLFLQRTLQQSNNLVNHYYCSNGESTRYFGFARSNASLGEKGRETVFNTPRSRKESIEASGDFSIPFIGI